MVNGRMSNRIAMKGHDDDCVIEGTLYYHEDKMIREESSNQVNIVVYVVRLRSRRAGR